MNNSLFLARLVGLYLVIISSVFILRRKRYIRVLEDFVKNEVLVYLSGIIAFIFGLLIILVHNLWIMDWRLIITLFGWIGLFKGIILLFLPDLAIKIFQPFIKNIFLLIGNMLIMLILGLWLILHSI